MKPQYIENVEFAESAEVFYAGFTFEGFRTLTKGYAIAPSDAARILSIDSNDFDKKAKSLIGDKYEVFDLRYECNGWAVTIDAMTTGTFRSVVCALTIEGWQPAINLKMSPFLDLRSLSSKKQETIKKDGREKAVQERLASKLKGSMEVACPSGYIDILTDTELIEVKSWVKWKEGVGQAVTYGHYYPKHQKRIHFFGKIAPKKREVVLFQCALLDILVTEE